MKRVQKAEAEPNQDDLILNLILEAFSSDSYLVVNKMLLNKFGPESAIFLSNLIDKFKYFFKQDRLLDGGFFLTYEQQTKQVGMSKKIIRRCKNGMIARGLISTKLVGIPPKEYYWINFNALVKEIELSIHTGNLNRLQKGTLIGYKRELLSNNKENRIKENKDKNFCIEDFLNKFPPDWQKDKSFLSAIESFITHRKQSKSSLTLEACKRLTIKLTKYSLPIAIAALERSVENGWTGVFPESIKPSINQPGSTPALTIEQARKDLADWFRSTCQLPDSRELRRLREGSPTEQRKAERWDSVPTPGRLVIRFDQWLENQSWIKDINPSIYNPEGKIFRRFLHVLQEEIGVNCLTGRSYSTGTS